MVDKTIIYFLKLKEIKFLSYFWFDVWRVPAKHL